MKVLVGVGDGDRPNAVTASAAIRLLQRLRLADAAYEVVNVVSSRGAPEREMVTLLPGADRDAEPERNAAARAAARALVEQAAREMSGTGRVETAVLTGKAAACLMDRADAVGADLIAVNGARHGSAFQALFTGSVARDIVIGARQSVLIARDLLSEPGTSEKVDAPEPVRAVLATDHSLYANRCVERLARFAPAGISRLAVVSAYPHDRLHALGPLAGDISVDAAVAVRDLLSERNDVVINVLSHHLSPEAEFTSHVVAAPVQEAIAQVVTDTQAELLILGAKGHGFVERILLGSISFRHAVVQAPYSVLILRA